jgi:hypothetical protein
MEREMKHCDIVKYTSGYGACVDTAIRNYEACVVECMMEYDSDCDEFVDPNGPGGGGGMGPCVYDLETGRCIPMR